ncbi:MAG: thioredoxin domain-containing protein [Cyclobacteriaceae bacterium]
MSNKLAEESSPYLLQHANNPVNWYAWNEASLDKAKDEDKPIIVSIGYSTCHWCHVMERESFENEAIAQVMNEHFVCIKVDREERPDVDQVYMDAVHAMGLQGGWPLNVFLTPDQKPFYGGTYFPAKGWMGLLQNIAEVFQRKREKLNESAEKFAEALNRDPLSQHSEGDYQLSKIQLHEINTNLVKAFDRQLGGMGSAPKFPMPVIWKYMVQTISNEDDPELAQQLHLTLSKIAQGGIYDQVGGGFARYSTDAKWFAPHFEKMLYDNGQLLSMYAETYKTKNDPEYEHVVAQTVNWLCREMLTDEGAFYSALDADSEGVEGKFYVWPDEEFKAVLGEDYDLAKEFYNTTEEGNWEHGWNILYKSMDNESFARKNGMNAEELESKIKSINDTLLHKRFERIRPGLDHKILTGWNALMSKGLLDAYSAFGVQQYLDLTVKNTEFICTQLIVDGVLYHDGGKKVEAFLDDYALVIELLTEAYQVTFDEKYLQQAEELAEVCMKDFLDTETNFFFYTSRKSERLIADKKEIYDNVIPASNSIMANNLLALGLIYENENYLTTANAMLEKLSSQIVRDPRYMTNWAVAMHTHLNEPFEIVIIGERAQEFRNELAKSKLPNHIFLGTDSNSKLPLLADRKAIDGKTTIYVCRKKTCQRPVFTLDEAIDLLKQ